MVEYKTIALKLLLKLPVTIFLVDFSILSDLALQILLSAQFGLLTIAEFSVNCLNFLFELVCSLPQHFDLIVENMLGFEVNEALLYGIFLLPLINIIVLFLFNFFFCSFDDTFEKKIGLLRVISITNPLRILRIIIISFAFLNLFFALRLYSKAIFYSSYGLAFFKQSLAVLHFGPITNFSLLADEFILFFVLLNAFVIFCCLFFISFNRNYTLCADVVRRSQLLLITQIFANLAFMSSDMLGFYIFYEAILIPVFFLIGIWGSSQRRIKAAYFFFFFTLVSSMPMLVGILITRKILSSTSYFIVSNYANLIDPNTQKIIWFLLFISFAFKIPMFPSHIWLPEAHVEAPTEGSMVLAGLLLKLGFFGFFKFLIQLFPDARDYFFNFVLILALISVVAASLTALRQTDLKRIIAYSSVVHMNFAIIGFCTLTQTGIVGAFITMFGHAVVSTILFSLIGSLYARTGTRLLTYYSGLVNIMPFFCIFFIFFCFFNAALPGSLSFIGEFFTFLAITENSLILLVVSLISFVTNIVYMLWLVNRLCFGDLNTNFIKLYTDLTNCEIDFYFSMLLISVLLGLMPGLLIDNLTNYIFLLN